MIKNEFLLKTDNVQIKPVLEIQAPKKKSPEEEFMEDFKGLCDNPADMNLYLEKMNAGKLPDTDQHINEILNAVTKTNTFNSNWTTLSFASTSIRRLKEKYVTTFYFYLNFNYSPSYYIYK